MNSQTLDHRKQLKVDMNYLVNGYTDADKGYLPKKKKRKEKRRTRKNS